MSDEIRKQCKIVAKQVKTGDLMAFVYYGKVKTIAATGSNVIVFDVDNKREMAVQGTELIESSLSADQFQEEEKVSKTRAAEILVNSPNRPLTVCFDKQDGTERTMRGRLVQPEPLLGRSMVEDLDIDGNNRLRQVDHRTIKWLIVDGMKYTVK